jgi:hypothetical protein
MKFINLILVLAVLLPPGLSQAQTVECDGLAGGGTGDFGGSAPCGPHDYMYRVTSPSTGGTMNLLIGTHAGNAANYTNLCLPAGWSFWFVPGSMDDFTGVTPHGLASPGPNGVCQISLAFSGPINPSIPEYIGFDHPGNPHDASWLQMVNPPGAVNWNGAVGGGLGPVHSPVCCNHDGIRGDWNGDGQLNIADLTYKVEYLFQGGPAPPCPEEADDNGDGVINIADLTYEVNFLFKGGPPPVPCP